MMWREFVSLNSYWQSVNYCEKLRIILGTTAEIRNNAVLLHKGKRMKVLEFQHVKPGKGGAFVRTKLKDIQTGKIIDETFNAGARIEIIRVEVKPMQYLYNDGDFFIFMDNKTYDQITVSESTINRGKDFLVAGINVDLLFDGQEILDIPVEDKNRENEIIDRLTQQAGRNLSEEQLIRIFTAVFKSSKQVQK